MKGWVLCALLAGWVTVAAQPAPRAPQPVDAFSGHPRVAILSDIGNEPDDQMSFVRLMLYSNELDLEALIATTSVWQKTATHPETMHKIIATYGEVRPHLLMNAKGWPEATALDSRVFAGQPGYGMAATGEGKDSPGAQALERAMERADPRPLWICVWGGANTLAQALMDVRTKHSAEETARIVGRLRVYTSSDQDDAGAWIRREFPGLLYITMPSTQDGSEYYYATWTGISGDLYYRNCEGADTSLVTNEWLDNNIRSKGPLGKMYPRFMFIMEGDTPTFLNLIDNGLNGYRRPDWGGWGGRYVYRQPHGETHPFWTQGGDEFARATSQDTVRGIDGKVHVSDQATVWRWREAYQNDFAARMSWTVEDFAHANHAPDLVVNGQSGTAPVEITAHVGETLPLDATGSRDPDAGQRLKYRWWVYPEAGLDGAHGAAVSIADGDQAKATVSVQSACAPVWLPGLMPCRGEGVAHIILEVTDDGSPRMTAYRRVVVRVVPRE
jgi:Cellulose-binding Sde182, nucleoside hydrolase-like domain/Cellulose-binding protein Sde0182, C-terminal domain